MSKTYCYFEPIDPGNNNWNCHIIRKTREEILGEYFPYWKEQMIKAGKENLISEDNCIEDWIVVNWAWEEEP